jgi:hypothetical protein
MVLCPRRGMVWHGATVPVVVALWARWCFASRPARHGLAVAFVIASWFLEGVVRKLVAAPRLSIILLLMVSVVTNPCSGVVALTGLAGLKSQGCRRGPHPVVGGVVHLSRRFIFGWWATVPADTTRRCCLVCTAWRRDGVWSGWVDCCPLSPYEVVRRACSCQSGYAWSGSISPLPSQRSGRRRGREELHSVRWRPREEVVVYACLCVWPRSA